MIAVDSHAHIWGRNFVPPAFFASAAEGWAAKEPSRKAEMILPKLLDGIVDETGDDFVVNMDMAGIDASFIMMIDVGAPVFGQEPETPLETQIDYYAELQRRHAGRLFCHVSVDCARPDQLALTRRAIRDGGLVGIGEITPDGFSAADESIRPLMRLAADLGVPVQIHTRAGVWTDFAGRDLTEANPVHPIHVARLAKEIPDLKIVLCHAGYPHWWQVTAELIADLPNCVLDISNWNETRHSDPAGLVGRLATWRNLVGADRILFASDQASGKRFTGSRSELGDWAAFIRELPTLSAQWGHRFTEAEASAILGQNALKFYNIAEESIRHANA